MEARARLAELVRAGCARPLFTVCGAAADPSEAQGEPRAPGAGPEEPEERPLPPLAGRKVEVRQVNLAGQREAAPQTALGREGRGGREVESEEKDRGKVF